MKCKNYSFSRHAIERMFEREISPDSVQGIITQGEIVTSYPFDKPHPSVLMLGYEMGRPVHVLVAQDVNTEACFVITVYRPDAHVWNDDYKTRRKL